MSNPGADRRWREANKDKVKAREKARWQKHKLLHPEIGTWAYPARDTRFKKGQPRSARANSFRSGHKINSGRPCWRKGGHIPEEERRRISAALSGSKSPNWRGGITAESQKIRSSIEMKLWRESVFKRDNFTCQECGAKNVMLNAHHVRSFARFPELRCDISNGQTLCVPCHKATDTYFSKGRRRA